MQSDFDQLQAALAAAKDRFETGSDNGRAGAYFAIQAVHDFLETLGVEHAAMSPLQGLMEALSGADRGVGSELLKPVKTVGAPGKSTPDLIFEQNVAVVTECCVRHLRSQGVRPFLKPAADLAAKLVNQAQPDHKITSTRAREIRERVQQLGHSDQGRAGYDILMSHDALAKDPIGWAKAVLSQEWSVTSKVSG